MPSTAAVHEQLVDVLVRVVGCSADDVQPRAKLKDLGVDSLSVVEVADEIGRRFDVYLADATVNGLRTVADIERAVVDHDGTPAPAWTRRSAVAPVAVAAADAGITGTTPPPPAHRPDAPRAARRLAFWMVAVGAAIGLGIGLGGSALVTAAGLHETSLPPLTQPTAEPTPTATPTETAEPEDDDAEPQPTLTVEKNQVPPGERFSLSGEFPGLGSGAELQVQVKDPGTDWDDFPVTASTTGDGSYRTVIYTSRTGDREFRMLHAASGKTSPAVKVRIG